MDDESLRCPHCGGPTETGDKVILTRTSSDGRLWSGDELAKERVLRCLDCGQQFSERHAIYARDGEWPPV